jgi:hypothetical protein
VAGGLGLVVALGFDYPPGGLAVAYDAADQLPGHLVHVAVVERALARVEHG